MRYSIGRSVGRRQSEECPAACRKILALECQFSRRVVTGHDERNAHSIHCALSGRITQTNQLHFQTLGIAAQGVVQCCHVLRTRRLGTRKV